MNEYQWKLIKKLIDSLPKPPNKRAVLFLKDWNSFSDKLLSLNPYDKSTKSLTRLRAISSERDHSGSSNGIDSLAESIIVERKPEPGKASGQGYAGEIQKLIDGIKTRITNVANDSVPKWKTCSSPVSLIAINSRTSNILSAILSAESSASKLKRLEEINLHLKKHPEAKIHAVKIGTIRVLLNFRKNARQNPTGNEADVELERNVSMRQVISETLALLGFCDPPRSSGLRILSIDGGGVRGIAVIKMLEQLEEMTGKKVYELFDFICGVSTGAIITCCTVPPLRMPMSSVHKLYMDLSQKVFKQNTVWGTSKLVFSRAYYETSVWEALLKEYVGSTSMLETNRHEGCPKICAVSTIVNHHRVAPFLFRNYSQPYLSMSDYQGSSGHTMFEAIRASAAAPTIFEEFRTGDLLHQDGGILVNNPTAVAIHEAKSLWPDEKISCIVSCGTGKHKPVVTVQKEDEASKSSSSWRRIFDKILDSATDTEGVHTMLNDLLPEEVYHRFNPHLTETIALDEIREDKIAILEQDTLMYCRRNHQKFKSVAKQLTESKSSVNKITDYVRLQMRLTGYSS